MFIETIRKEMLREKVAVNCTTLLSGGALSSKNKHKRARSEKRKPLVKQVTKSLDKTKPKVVNKQKDINKEVKERVTKSKPVTKTGYQAARKLALRQKQRIQNKRRYYSRSINRIPNAQVSKKSNKTLKRDRPTEREEPRKHVKIASSLQEQQTPQGMAVIDMVRRILCIANEE